MRALIMDEFTRIGGGQKLFYIVEHELRELGYVIDVVTDSTHRALNGNFNKIIETTYNYIDGETYYRVLPKILRLRHELSRLEGYDLTINNHPNVFLYNATVNCMHTPSLFEPLVDENGHIRNKVPFQILRYLKLFRVYEEGIFWVSSEYSKMILENVFKALKITIGLSKVIPIPVKIPENLIMEEKNSDIILSFGRISPDKEIEVILRIARRCRKKFIIAGAVNPGNEDYLKEISRNKPQNVEIIANPDDSIKDVLFRKAGIYLHTKRGEMFGIAVEEAIAYGCVPVVPKSGGPWTDIVKYGLYGYGYNGIEDAVEIINSSSEFSNSVRTRIQKSSERYSSHRFSQDFSELIKFSLSRD